MGNELPSSKPSPIKSPYFTSVQSVTHSKEQFLLCKKAVPHNRLRQRWSSIVNELRNIPHEHIMVPKNWRVLEKSICGNGQIIEIEYDHYDSNLAELIEQRAMGGKYFEESELWYVLYALSEVAVNCRFLGYRVGDIRPQNILMNRQGQIKVLTHQSFPNDSNPFTERQAKALFSPQQLQLRRKGCMENVSDPIKNEAFSIGLTVLSMALLHNMCHIYDREEDQINEKLLDKAMDKLAGVNYFNTKDKVASKYSEGLCHGLKLLLQIDSRKRLGFYDLYNQLHPHIRQLQDFEPFQIHFVVHEEPEKPQTANKHPRGNAITLRSRHRKSRPETTTKADYVKVSSKYLPMGQATLIESRMVSRPSYTPFNELSTTGNNQLLRQIDDKLRRSREEFPS